MKLIKEIAGDLTSPLVFPALAQGLIIGVLLTAMQVSFANLIFSGPLAPLAPRAVGLTLFGAMAMCLACGLLSSFKGIVTCPQDVAAAVLAGSAAAVASALAGADPEARFATVAALMGLSGLVTALFFLAVGVFRLSNLVRFLPYPVVGGFLGGSGMLLCLGGLGVMTGTSPGLDTLGAYFAAPLLPKWLFGAGFGLAAFVRLKTRPHYLALPVCLAVAVAGFYLGCHVLGVDVAEARRAGWLPGTVPTAHLWPALQAADLAAADWGAALGQLPELLVVAFLAVIAFLLNMGGIEIAARRDLDMDRELLAGAAGNALAALGGGFAGHSMLSMSMLSHRTGMRTRLVPVCAAAVCAGVLFFGGGVLSYLPLPIVGGLLFLLGMFFFEDWVLGGWRKLAPLDFCVVLAIVATVARAGFLAGVTLGLLLATVIFLFRFSRVSVIREEGTGEGMASRLERPVASRVILREHGRATHVLVLHGYVFFGSAWYLSGRVGALLKGRKPPRYLVLDLSEVGGFDISAASNFQRMAQQAHARGAHLVLCAAPDRLWELLERNAAPDVMASVRRVADLDRGLEWCEDRILEAHKAALRDADARDRLFHLAYEDLDAHLRDLERFEAVLESLDGLVVERQVRAGEDIYAQGAPLDGVHFVVWGSVGEYRGAERLRRVGRGSILAPGGALRDAVADHTARAEEDGVLAFVSRASLAELPTRSGGLCAALYRLLLRQAVEEGSQSFTRNGRKAN